LVNQQILKIHSIDVVIRDPKDRLVSGINTFIQHTLRDNPDLDRSTVQWFAQNYLHLDRHYCSQFNWLLNLARYTKPDTQLNFLSMKDIGVITSGIDRKPAGIEIASNKLAQQIQQTKNNEMYQRIDTVIFESIGQSMTFHQLLQQIKKFEPAAHEYVIEYAQKILKSCTVLD
jgi:hypothetical protein